MNYLIYKREGGYRVCKDEEAEVGRKYSIKGLKSRIEFEIFNNHGFRLHQSLSDIEKGSLQEIIADAIERQHIKRVKSQIGVEDE